MIRNKSHKLKVIALGAINGLVFGTLLETILRSLFLYEKFLRNKKPSGNFSISYLPYPFNWWFLPLMFFVAATFATFIVHRYFARFTKSNIWFWQIVGVGAVFGCAVYLTLSIFRFWYFSEYDFPIVESLKEDLKSDLFSLLVVLPFVAAFNLLFALVLKWRKLNLP